MDDCSIEPAAGLLPAGGGNGDRTTSSTPNRGNIGGPGVQTSGLFRYLGCGRAVKPDGETRRTGRYSTVTGRLVTLAFWLTTSGACCDTWSIKLLPALRHHMVKLRTTCYLRLYTVLEGPPRQLPCFVHVRGLFPHPEHHQIYPLAGWVTWAGVASFNSRRRGHTTAGFGWYNTWRPDWAISVRSRHCEASARFLPCSGITWWTAFHSTSRS